MTADGTLLVGYKLATFGIADPGVTIVTILQRGSGAVALFNPNPSIVTQKRHPRIGILNSEMPGDGANAFLH